MLHFNPMKWVYFVFIFEVTGSMKYNIFCDLEENLYIGLRKMNLQVSITMFCLQIKQVIMVQQKSSFILSKYNNDLSITASNNSISIHFVKKKIRVPSLR